MHLDKKISEPTPPGTYSEMLPHPAEGKKREIELAIFQDHRFSFFYWLKWTGKLRGNGHSSPPTLVTIDWHRDLAPPSDKDKKSLTELDQQDLEEARAFTIDMLDPHNDGHLLSAAWLNLIGDIILLKNYGMDQEDTWIDQDRNVHHILEYRDFDTFQSEVASREDEYFYLDIDIDYFIQDKVSPYQRVNVELYEDQDIRSVVDPKNPLFQYLLKRLEGITLATEPRYCGGVRNSNHILDIILNQLFTQEMEWKHKK